MESQQIHQQFVPYLSVSDNSVVIANGVKVNSSELLSLLNNKYAPKDIVGIAKNGTGIDHITFLRQMNNTISEDNVFISIFIAFKIECGKYPFIIIMNKFRYNGKFWRQNTLDCDFQIFIQDHINDMITECGGTVTDYSDIDINYIYKLIKVYIDNIDEMINSLKCFRKSCVKSANY
jgi:hypothetical protein